MEKKEKEKILSEEETTLLINNKIAEAKLYDAEKRIVHLQWFFGTLLTIFIIATGIIGVYIPFSSSNKAEESVKEAVDKMQETLKEEKNEIKEFYLKIENKNSNFEKEILGQQEKTYTYLTENTNKAIKEVKEDAQKALGQQLAKPKLVCLYKGTAIDGINIPYKREDGSNSIPIEILNEGDAPANNIYIYIYVKDGSDIHLESEWESRGVSEEPGYKESYRNTRSLPLIQEKIKSLIELTFYANDSKEKVANIILKIYCDRTPLQKMQFNLVRDK